MIGVELDPAASSGDRDRMGRHVCAAAMRRGVFLRPLGNVVVVMPPLTTTADEARRVVSVLTESIAEVVSCLGGHGEA
jgi:adenosylmethionine---8-amino-7-oxononanoate aminotransferase